MSVTVELIFFFRLSMNSVKSHPYVFQFIYFHNGPDMFACQCCLRKYQLSRKKR